MAPAAAGHPWTGAVFAAAWGAAEPLSTTLVQPQLVAEISGGGPAKHTDRLPGQPGQSGSPVIFYAAENTSFLASNGEAQFGPAWDLADIYSGRIDKDSDVGIVWKRSAINDIVERGQRPGTPTVSPFAEDVDPAALANPPT